MTETDRSDMWELQMCIHLDWTEPLTGQSMFSNKRECGMQCVCVCVWCESVCVSSRVRTEDWRYQLAAELQSPGQRSWEVNIIWICFINLTSMSCSRKKNLPHNNNLILKKRKETLLIVNVTCHIFLQQTVEKQVEKWSSLSFYTLKPQQQK